MKKSLLLKIAFISLFLVSSETLVFSQKIGLVLSGGGATGFAHIGVIKALEERGIPIDYITGTSAGALVGSMYAAGYSPTEIEKYVLNVDFQYMASGKLDLNRDFLFQKEESDASLIQVGFSKDSILQKSLPTSFIKPTLLDYEMMRILGVASANSENDFNKLFVPFRCVASDIVAKESVVYSSGNLNECVRASMTYPFFINPIRIEGKLLFDGGLYNNFPSDVMYMEFSPDFIIGSNVSGNANPPKEDDLISQITNMLVRSSSFELPCDQGIIIQPKTNVSTFDFADVQNAINDGYQSTIHYLDSIHFQAPRLVSPEEVQQRRDAFRAKTIPLRISSLNTMNHKGYDVSFIRKSFLRNTKKIIINESTLNKRYFRAASLPQVEYLYPTLHLKMDSTYHMDIQVQKKKDFLLEVGGVFSSRPINTGYIGVSYFHIRKMAYKIKAESYFGKFYGSVKVKLDLQFPSYYPISISPYFVLNRWDYFRSSATFFEDVKPSFLVQNEVYYGIQVKNPIRNKAKSTLDLRMFDLNDNYYQSSNFTSVDTSDLTQFKGYIASWQIEFNSLNRKQFANSGSLISFKARYVNGKEKSVSGSTSPTQYEFFKKHDWINFIGEAQSYFIDKSHFHWGIHGKATFNSQSLFKNYTATLLAMTTFSPIPDMNTLFLPQFRAPQHVGVGTNIVFTVRKNWDIRLDAYVYQAFKEIEVFSDGSITYSTVFPKERYIGSASLIYNSRFGPMRVTGNYFPSTNGYLKTDLFIQVSYGYILFNERAIR